MNDKPIKEGSHDWAEYSLLLDVSAEAEVLYYGFLLEGPGQIWVSGVKLEEVGPIPTDPNRPYPYPAPRAPVNLGFK